jgi:hypothetical protein
MPAARRAIAARRGHLAIRDRAAKMRSLKLMFVIPPILSFDTLDSHYGKCFSENTNEYSGPFY